MFRQSKLFRRAGTRVDWSESVGESFQRNQVLFRAESRMQVAWLRPEAFVEVDLEA